MTNITPIPVTNYRAQRSEETISLLRSLLERAEQGEIVEAAVAWVNSQGYTANCRSCSEDLSRLLGSIAMMQYRLTKDIYDAAEHVTVTDDPEAS